MIETLSSSDQKQEPCIGCVRGGSENPAPAVIRGNCRPCAKVLYRAIAAGDLTDERAIELGLWLAPSKTGRPATVSMHAAIDAALDAALDGSATNTASPKT